MTDNSCKGIIEKVSYPTAAIAIVQEKSTNKVSRKRQVEWAEDSNGSDSEVSTVDENGQDLPPSDLEEYASSSELSGSWRSLRSGKHPSATFFEVYHGEHPVHPEKKPEKGRWKILFSSRVLWTDPYHCMLKLWTDNLEGKR